MHQYFSSLSNRLNENVISGAGEKLHLLITHRRLYLNTLLKQIVHILKVKNGLLHYVKSKY